MNVKKSGVLFLVVALTMVALTGGMMLSCEDGTQVVEVDNWPSTYPTSGGSSTTAPVTVQLLQGRIQNYDSGKGPGGTSGTDTNYGFVLNLTYVTEATLTVTNPSKTIDSSLFVWRVKGSKTYYPFESGKFILTADLKSLGTQNSTGSNEGGGENKEPDPADETTSRTHDEYGVSVPNSTIKAITGSPADKDWYYIQIGYKNGSSIIWASDDYEVAGATRVKSK